MISMPILKAFEVIFNVLLKSSFFLPPSNRYIMRQQAQINAPSSSEPPMHLAVVACGDRLEETLTMAKSAVLFSIKRLHVHIFAEDQLHASFMEAVSFARTAWPSGSSSVIPRWGFNATSSPMLCLFSWSRGLVLFAPSSTTRSTPSASPARTQPSGRNCLSPAPLRGSSYRWAQHMWLI